MANLKQEVKFEQPSEILIILNKYILIFVALVAAAILALGYFFVLKPNIADLKNQQSASTDTESMRQQNQLILTRLQQLRDEYNNIKNNRLSDLQKLAALMPDKPLTPELFAMADVMAKNRGLILNEVEIVDAKPDATLALNTSTNAQLGIKTLIVHLSVSKPLILDKSGKPIKNEANEESLYQTIKLFLTDLENNLRLMDVENITFSGVNPTVDDMININLKTYYRD